MMWWHANVREALFRLLHTEAKPLYISFNDIFYWCKIQDCVLSVMFLLYSAQRSKDKTKNLQTGQWFCQDVMPLVKKTHLLDRETNLGQTEFLTCSWPKLKLPVNLTNIYYKTEHEQMIETLLLCSVFLYVYKMREPIRRVSAHVPYLSDIILKKGSLWVFWCVAYQTDLRNTHTVYRGYGSERDCWGGRRVSNCITLSLIHTLLDGLIARRG